MNALAISFAAAAFAALSNLFFRKNTLHSPYASSSGFLVLFYFISFVTSIVINPSVLLSDINFIVVFIGGCVGMLNIALMHVTSRALKHGPAGLTFAFQNTSAVFPGLLLFLMFDPVYGFSCAPLQLVGTFFVVCGLFLGAKKESSDSSKTSPKWFVYAIGCFAIQMCALTLIQGRCVLFDCDKIGGFLSAFAVNENDDKWFMPAQFGVAFLLQSVFFLTEKRRLSKPELTYGFLSGIANFSSTCLLLLATKFALPFEKSMLFPCFSVGTLLLCNTWAKKLYKEDFNLASNAMCSLGVFIGVLA